MKKDILLQGYPGVGKTTVVKNIVAGIESAGGFYTEEIREGKTRRGFQITTLEGEQGILAYEGGDSPYRVGKYGVDLSVLEAIGVKSIRDALEDKSIRLVIIDEIGEMELFSARFQEVVIEAFDSSKKVLATVPVKSSVFVEALKSRKGSDVIRVTAANRNSVAGELLKIILDA